MTKKEGSKLYLVRWHNDGYEAITDGYQIEAIRHSEKKHYNGEPQMTIIREATAEDIARETIKICMTQNVRPDFPFGAIGGVKPGTVLRAGQEYAAASNRHGAISGICEP